MSNTNFPTSIDSPTDPLATNKLNAPSHSAQHGFENDAIVALETKVGVNGSAITTSLDYITSHLPLANITATGTPSSANFLRGDGTWSANITGVQGRFGGTGADGSLNVVGGNVQIDLGNAAVFVKNYSAMNITGSYKLSFINPNTNGTTIILKSQGNVTLTSSATPMIDCSSLGGATGSEGYSFTILKTNVGTSGAAGSPPTGGVGGALPTLSPATIVASELSGKYPFVIPGSGGATGGGGAGTGGGGGASAVTAGSNGSNGNNSTASASGAGGAGGGVLVIECGGALNFTTTSGISVAGISGANAVSGVNGGGGGGGGGGVCLVFYNLLTAKTGTITSSGGSGGLHSGLGGNGGGGGNGYSLIALNTEFY